jgi:hypothetical protein
MATRKQRSKRAKSLRHDYAFVVDDEEGNEVEITADEARARKQGESGAPAKTPTARGSRATASGKGKDYAPNPPSWNRALRRGLPWGLVAGVVVTFLLHGSPLLGLVYAVMFVPLTYWTDSMVYRRFQRKQAAGRPPRQGKTR